MAAPKILAFAGSARIDSFNKKLLKVVADGARAAGAEVTIADLRDYPLPLFDEELEARDGLPPAGRKLKDLMLAAQGFLIASPEYNSSITPLLKNAIDWTSRPTPTEPSLAAYIGKTAALMSASPGALGGLRGLVHLRAILGNIQVLVLPTQVCVGAAPAAFLADGSMKDPKQQSQAEALGASLAGTLAKLHR